MDLRAWGLLLGVAAVLAYADHRYHQLPPAQPVPGFDPARAAAQLPALAAHGRPHPVGTTESASVAATLVNELLKAGYAPEIQTGYACGPLAMCGSFRNVLAKKPGLDDGVVLLLAHHDSTPATSGGYDNALGAAVVLEIARQLEQAPPLRHEVLFLFDDGEEVGLLGAQGFLEHHPDAARVRAVVNVDGLAGPTSFRFVGPGDAWLSQVAAGAVTRPWTSSYLATFDRFSNGFDDSRLFAARAIPNAVLGGVQGYAIYHSPLDRAESVDPRAIAERGAATVALLRGLASGELQPDPGRGVYFDLLGAFLLGWPVAQAPWVALAAAALVLLLIGLSRPGAGWPWASLVRGAVSVSLAAALAVLVPVLARALFLEPVVVDRSLWIPASGLLVAWLGAFWGVAVAALLPDGAGQGGWLGVLGALAGLALSLVYPGASYLVVVPTIVGGVAALSALGVSRRFGRSPYRAGPPLLLAMALAASVSALVGAGDGLGEGLLASLPRAWAALGLLPVWVALPRGVRRRVVLVLGLAFGGALVATAVDTAQPRLQSSTLRLQRIDDGPTRGLVIGALPASWRAQADWQEAIKVFPWSSGSVPGWVATSTLALGPGPVLLDRSAEARPGGRRLRARACTRRGAAQLLLAFPGEAQLERVQIEDQAVTLPEGAARWLGGWQTISLAALVEGCARIEVETHSREPLVLWLSDLGYGLPGSVEAWLGPRPEGYVPQHLGDATMTTVRVDW